MSHNECIEISLVIDDNNSISFKLEISQTNDKNLLKLSNEIAQKYKLPNKTKSILYQNLLKEVEKIKHNEIKRSLQYNSIKQGVINRLYYQSTQVKKEKEELFAQQRNQKKKDELISCSFVPHINKKSHLLSSKRNINESIGDKLYNQRKKRGFDLHPGSTLDIINQYLSYNAAIEREHQIQEDNNKNNRYDINNTQRNGKESKEIAKVNRESNRVHIAYNSNQKKSKVISLNYDIKKIHKNDNTEKLGVNPNLFTNISLQQKLFSPREVNTPIKRKNNDNIETFSLSFNNEENNFHKKITQHSRKKRTTTPSNNNDLHNKLYLSYRDVETKRLNEQENFFKENYPFEPEISKESRKLMKHRNESPNQFYTRLTYTKTPLKNIVNKSNKSSTPKSTLPNKLLKSSPGYLNKNKIKEVQAEKQLSKNIQQMQTDKKKGIKVYQQNANSNLEKYKLNQIKEMYNLLCKDGNIYINFDNLYKENVPSHIIEKVVKPTCNIINERNLEFNFQNFYVIARELLNKFFI